MSDTRPTLYLANWSGRKLHGPGRKLTIMARPRRWEHGDGVVPALAPCDADLTTALMLRALSDRGSEREAASMRVYREAMERRWEHDGWGMLGPGRLTWLTTREIPRFSPEGEWHVVRDGDSLLCACARGAECHRRWAVPYLARAGWRVILDGEVFDATD